jgi:hypothetical protein
MSNVLNVESVDKQLIRTRMIHYLNIDALDFGSKSIEG